MNIGYAIYDTKFGSFEIRYKNDEIVMIKKTSISDKYRKDDCKDKVEGKTELTDKTITQLIEYFEGDRKVFDIPYKLEGTDFQMKVWNALTTIPYGETRSYKDIAIQVGNEKASRAIGMANNKNPISIIVPCHRVIGSNGKLVGYESGLDMKEKILNIEKMNKDK